MTSVSWAMETPEARLTSSCFFGSNLGKISFKTVKTVYGFNAKIMISELVTALPLSGVTFTPDFSKTESSEMLRLVIVMFFGRYSLFANKPLSID